MQASVKPPAEITGSSSSQVLDSSSSSIFKFFKCLKRSLQLGSVWGNHDFCSLCSGSGYIKILPDEWPGSQGDHCLNLISSSGSDHDDTCIIFSRRPANSRLPFGDALTWQAGWHGCQAVAAWLWVAVTVTVTASSPGPGRAPGTVTWLRLPPRQWLISARARASWLGDLSAAGGSYSGSSDCHGRTRTVVTRPRHGSGYRTSLARRYLSDTFNWVGDIWHLVQVQDFKSMRFESHFKSYFGNCKQRKFK